MPPKKKDPNAGSPQIGRRPSNPSFLALVGLMWVVAGVAALLKLRAGWKIAVGIVFIGIGLFYLRGAAMTVVRREERTRKPK
jgi:hypothetical protein